MPIIKYTKQIDGTLYVAEAVGENTKRELHIMSAYMQKNNPATKSPDYAASRVADVTSPDLDALDVHGSPATDSVAQGTASVKPVVTDDHGNDLAVELPGGTVAINTDGVRYSLNSFTPEEKERVNKALGERFSAEDVDRYLKNATGIAAEIAKDKARLDFEANPVQSFQNGWNCAYHGSSLGRGQGQRSCQRHQGARSGSDQDSRQRDGKDNAVLIPMLVHTGKVTDSTDTMVFARAISELTGRPFVAALEGAERAEGRHDAKKKGKAGASQEELGFRKVLEIPEGTFPIFVDNVVGKGITADAARAAMGGGMTLAYTKTIRSPRIEGLKNAVITYDTKQKPDEYSLYLSRKGTRWDTMTLTEQQNLLKNAHSAANKAIREAY